MQKFTATYQDRFLFVSLRKFSYLAVPVSKTVCVVARLWSWSGYKILMERSLISTYSKRAENIVTWKSVLPITVSRRMLLVQDHFKTKSRYTRKGLFFEISRSAERRNDLTGMLIDDQLLKWYETYSSWISAMIVWDDFPEKMSYIDILSPKESFWNKLMAHIT